jgi:hypothetical protein
MLVYATREDLLPDFRHYAAALAQWPQAAASDVRARRRRHRHRPVRRPQRARHPGATVAAAAKASPLALHQALLHAAALHLLRFDERVALRCRQPGGGERQLARLQPRAHLRPRRAPAVHPRSRQLWPAGLLQMALFAGRNTPWLVADDPAMPALGRWAVADASAFDAQCRARVLDHGLAQYIFPVHLLKTWVAVRDEIALGVADDTAQALRAAVNRLLFGARFKQRHLLRTARQAAGFVARED